MPDERVFNASVLDSYANLKFFLTSSASINEVLSRKNKPFSKVLSPLNPNLQGKWQVCQIATAPFRGILAIVLKIVAKIASLLGAKEFAKQAKTAAQYQLAGFGLYSETPTKLFRIKDSVNRPNPEGQIVNRTPAIPESRITDPKVKKKTFCIVDKAVEFNHQKGICRGMCEWFLYLYLHTKSQFSDPRRHMLALGKQFAKGGGMDPTLLQSLFLNKGKLLNMKFGAQTTHTRYPISLFEHTPIEWKAKAEPIMRELQNLPAGAYGVGLPLHQTAYIKIDDRLGYFFDPNHGITEINGDSVGEKLYELITTSLKETKGETAKGHGIFPLHVDVTPVRLRS